MNQELESNIEEQIQDQINQELENNIEEQIQDQIFESLNDYFDRLEAEYKAKGWVVCERTENSIWHLAQVMGALNCIYKL